MDQSEGSTKRKSLEESRPYYRKVQGLISAQTITDPPRNFKQKLRGAKAKGITYEKLVGRRLLRWSENGELAGKILLSQWFSFFDQNGNGHCQPDILILSGDFIFILECKLSYKEYAWGQMKDLYKPIVEKVFGRPAMTIQVCKNLYFNPGNLIPSLQEFMDSPRSGKHTWHFLGN